MRQAHMKTQAQQTTIIEARAQVNAFEAKLRDAIKTAPHEDAIAPVLLKVLGEAGLSDATLMLIESGAGRIPHDRIRRFV